MIFLETHDLHTENGQDGHLISFRETVVKSLLQWLQFIFLNYRG